MKRIDRWLSILMCLCMLSTSMLGDLAPAFAEGEVQATIADLGETASTEAAAEEPELTLGGDAAPAAAELAAEESAEVTDSSAFTFGYAKIVADAALYADFGGETALATLTTGGIVLVTERRTEGESDLMKVAFVYEDAAEEGWVDVSALVQLTDEEAAAFQSGITEAVCYQDDVNYPLPEPALVLPEVTAAPEPTAEAESTAEPKVSVDAESTVEPEAEGNVEPETTAESEATEEPESVETQEASDADQPVEEPEITAAPVDSVVMLNTALYSEDEVGEVSSEAAAVEMTLSQESAELTVGETLEIRPAFSDGVSRSVSYNLSASGVVSIDAATGVVTAVAPGSVTVQVKCAEIENAAASMNITVVENTDNVLENESSDAVDTERITISINPEALNLIVGESQQIACTLPEGTEGTVEYTLSAENVISLDDAGNVTALAEGACTITAALMHNGAAVATAQCMVNVYALNELKATMTAELDVNQTAAIAVEVPEALLSRISYASSDEAVAKVDASGVVTAIGAGECAITLTLGALTSELPMTVYTQPAAFELNISKTTLNAGETAQLSVALPEYTRGEVNYETQNTDVIGVAQDGLVMAIGAGAAEITATIGEVTRSVTIEVYGKPTSLELTLEETSLAAGYHTQAKVELSKYIVAEITYRSSDTNIATVDSDGVVTAVAEGYCDIIAEADNGVEAKVMLTVVDSVVSLHTKYHEMAVGQKLSLSYTVSDESLASETAVFGSSNTAVATVDPLTGLVKAVSDGEAIITLTLGETGQTAKCYLTVRKAPTKVTITSATKTIGVKQVTSPIGYKLYADSEATIGTVTFKSSNTKVVKVNGSGQMLGVKAGTATITVTAFNGPSASFKVTVKKAPSKLTVSPTSATLAVGQSGKISYTLTSNTAAGMTFTSSDKNIVTVDASGNVKAVGIGTAKVKVSTHNGLVKYSTITVKKAPENVTLSLSASKLGVGMTATAKGSVDTSSNVGFTYEYWTDKPDVISVNAKTGAIKALAVGTANVYVKTYNGVTSHSTDEGRVETSAQVNVVPKPDKVTIDGTNFTIIVGRIIKLPVVMTMNDGSKDCLTTYSLATTNKKIAQVNSAGQVKGVKAGTATIKLTAGNGDVVSVKVTVMSKPTKVVLNKSSLTLGEGMTSSLAARVYYTSKKYYTHSSDDALGMGGFSSSNSSIVKIDSATGAITAVGKGNATLSYTTYNGKKATCKVTVLGKPTAIDMNVDTLKLGVGMTSTLTPVYQANELGPVTFASSDPAIATVDATSGKVKAVAEGQAIVTIDAGNGVTNTCKVNVVPKPDKVTIDGTNFTIIVGRIIKLPVVMTMNDGSKDCLTTYSLATSNKKIAQVNSAGQVKGVKAGTATIKLTAGNGDVVSVKVTVMSKPTKVVLNKSSLTLGEGMTSSLAARVYYTSKKYYTHSSDDALGMGGFSSSNSSIVKIDSATGAITAVAKGNATLSYTTYNGKKATCKVTVLAAPTSLNLGATEINLGEKMTSTLGVTFNAYEYGSLSFKSSDKSVATVNSSGKITAVSAGEATITVSTLNDVSAACKVMVSHAPDKVTLNMSTSNVAISGKITLKPTGTYQGSTDNCMATYTYKSSNTKVATVTSAGVVKGIKAGSATIRVTAQNGAYADCKIVVRKKPTKVIFDKSSASLGVGQRIKIAGKIYYSGGSCLFSPNDTSYARLTIDDSTIAKLDSKTGEVIGVEVGRTYLRLTTYNGKTVKCLINVGPGPEWISFDNSMLTMSRGESQTLTCSKSAGSVTTLTYSSSNSSVVSVSGSGSSCKLTAVAKGTATITATSSNGKTTTCEVTVMAKPEKIAFESSAITIGLNETAALPDVLVTSSEGECSQAVAYSVSGTAVTMASPGYVTGVKAGTATVTASTSSGLTATCSVTVAAEPTTLTLVPAASTIAVGDTTTLSVKMDAAGSYTFTVDNDSVLDVTAAGKVTALKPGTATITATAYNGYSDSCTITVLAVPQWVRLSSDEVTLGVGMKQQLTASIQENTLGTVVYASSNENVATVDASGNITAIAPGSALIRAYIVGHETIFDTCELTVLSKPTKVALSESELTLRKGAVAQLDVAFSCESSADCYGTAKYATSNASVAAVDQSGVIAAVGAGEAEITVSLDSDSSVSATCKVIVVESSVGFDVSALTMSIGETYPLRVDLPDGENNFSISSSDEAIVKVDAQSRVITAMGEGAATITAVNGSDTAVCTVKVTQKPTSISIAAPEKRVVIGKTFALEAETLPAGTAAQLSYTSTDEKVATVSEAGLIKAVGYGSAVIRVSNQDGSLTAECSVTAVYEPEMIRFGELDDIVISAGDSYTLEAPVMYNSNGDCDSAYTLAISNSSCASLSIENGRYVIHALAEGSAALRLKTANGKTATHTVVVVAAPTSIGFENAAIRMAVGETFEPAVRGSNGAVAKVTLTSDSPCVSVTSDGALKAVSEGTATITAASASFSGLTAKATVQVVKAPSSVTLSPASITLAEGESSMLTVGFDSGAASASVRFVSSDETAVQTGSDGSILAVGVGSATITATTFNGKSASCTVTVKAAPTALSIQPGSISACVKDAVQLTAQFGSTAEFANLAYESDNSAVAEVNENGLVTFSAIGETVIYVSTFNGLSVEVPVKVSETPSSVSFNPDSAVILAGDTAQLNIVFDKGAGYCTLTSSDPATASVSADGTVRALKAGKTTISLEMPGLGLNAKCDLTVVDALDGISLAAEKTTLELHETTLLTYALSPANAIGTGLVTFESSDTSVAEVDRRTGLVTGVAYGTAVITASTADGKTAQLEINVLGGKRRMLVAYYFGEAGDAGYLPFAYNNGYSMTQAFSTATVEGQKYDIAGPMSNAPKATLFGTIAAHFADATDDDVSIIYICAHGSGSYGPTGEYAFALDNTHYVMASELMNALEKIKGRVVLIMDSCHSGGIIDCNKSRLDAQGGRISIMASSHRNTNSCYWNVSQKLTSVDFFTHALLQGVGFNEAQGIGGDRGWFQTVGGPADDAGNGDRQITISELFSYAKAVTISNVTTFQGRPEFCGNPAQTPQSYIGSMNKDLVLFAR